MVIVQGRSKKSQTGARYKSYRHKRKYEIGRAPALTKPGEKKIKTVRTKGGGKKLSLFSAQQVNLVDKKNKYLQGKIISVVENPANRHFVRRNIMTKGTIVDTNKGKARITSRPGQDGIINAVLL